MTSNGEKWQILRRVTSAPTNTSTDDKINRAVDIKHHVIVNKSIINQFI